jgi:hypothetical protein
MYRKSLLILTILSSVFSTPAVYAENGDAVWTPSATEYDWVQLTSGEWLKGEIKSMYNESLEFDSDKLDLLEIDMEDVKFLQSFRPTNVNIENVGPVTGVLNISEDKITITDGENVKKYDIIELISFAPGGEREIDFWTVKLTLSLNLRTGNTEQVDYTAQFSAKRRTAKSRFFTDYIGNISQTDAVTGIVEETANNHRVNTGLDIYATRYFFYTPVFAEYFSDPFQNIDQRTTIGVGVGYTVIDANKIEWNVSGGPSVLTTRYISVLPGEEIEVSSGSLALGTNLDAEISSTLDFIFKYNIQLAKEDAGGYTHHTIATLESELTDKLDLDISAIWDRIAHPAVDDTGVEPEQNDFRFLLGLAYSY